MLLTDSSVWVDYFNGRTTRETDHLDGLLGVESVAIGDLILAEVLQGFRKDEAYAVAKRLLTNLAIYEMLDAIRAVQVAENYRFLRKKGITIRKTSDAIIATFCIERDVPLLFADKDFDPFVAHLGLRSALGRR